VGVTGSSLCQEYGVTPGRALKILQDFAQLKYPTRTINDELYVFGKDCDVYAESARASRGGGERAQRVRRRPSREAKGPKRASSAKSRPHGPRSSRRVSLAMERLADLAAAKGSAAAGAGAPRSTRGVVRAAPPEVQVNETPSFLEPTYLQLLKRRRVEGPPPAMRGIEAHMFDPEALRLARNRADAVSTLEALVLSHGLRHTDSRVQPTQFCELTVDGRAAPAASSGQQRGAFTKSVGGCHTGPGCDQLNRIAIAAAFPALRRQDAAALPVELALLPTGADSAEAALGCPWVLPGGGRNAPMYRSLAAQALSVVGRRPGCTLHSLLPLLRELHLSVQQLPLFLAMLVRDNLLRREVPTSCALVASGFGCPVRLQDLALHTAASGEQRDRAVYFIV